MWTPRPLSALQHWAYCPSQCGLIHHEQAFDDNLHTLRGNAVHAQVDRPGFELRRGLRVERALPLFSDRPGLVGKADTVEFEADGTPYPLARRRAPSTGRAWVETKSPGVIDNTLGFTIAPCKLESPSRRSPCTGQRAKTSTRCLRRYPSQGTTEPKSVRSPSWPLRASIAKLPEKRCPK
jgi:hypothetical protein